MADRPTAAELAEAVREFLEAEVLPTAPDARLRFRTLVAANALAILQRDLEVGDELLREELTLLRSIVQVPGAGSEREQVRALNAELACRIRGGNPPPGALPALRRIAELKLRVASPRYLRHGP